MWEHQTAGVLSPHPRGRGTVRHRLRGGHTESPATTPSEPPRMREREPPHMTATTTAPTTHQGILDFVTEVAAMTQPDRIHWCTGSDEEWTELTDALVSTGTFTRLNPAIKPNSF